ncbi:hypothetical protein OH146_00800 [Salinibacterium sp. SYSU T00001]|uniref:hypothetical protein n=1 Tax=Homoserinimonas sedimenticola TaxID=2986805 RepID=UPI00223657FD|nr:hypothetical protein [Salinibacterium sedimenticola]MCW4384309.1 hypothetical protein [Salinibacterium sedimenticola]
MIDHVVLLLLMGVAAAGVIAMLFPPSPRVFIIAAIWFAGCLVPLVLAQASRIPDPLSLSDAMDFAGAAALHLSLAVYASTAIRVSASPAPTPPIRERAGWRAVVGAVALVAAWCAWIVALEGRLTVFTAALVGNVLLSALGGLGGATLVAGLRARHRNDPLGGLLAGLAAASAAASGIPPAAALSVGFAAGIVAVMSGARGGVVRPRSWIRPTGMGALIGLLAVGVLDVRSGFFFTGQPTAVIAQLVLVAVAIVVPAALGAVGGLIGRGGTGAASASEPSA